MIFIPSQPKSLQDNILLYIVHMMLAGISKTVLIVSLRKWSIGERVNQVSHRITETVSSIAAEQN